MKGLSALRHPNYRLFFTGQAVSLIGTWMTRVASSWLVYRLSNDPFMLGVATFAALIPSFALAPLAGVIVDRSRSVKRLIFLTQAAGMLQSLGMVAVTVSSLAPETAIQLLIGLNFVQGVINALDMPSRQAFLPRMVPDPKDLPNAIALNGTVFHAARLVGPALAGALVSLYGEAWCFGIDALSYVAVLWAVWAIRIDDPAAAASAAEAAVAGLRADSFYGNLVDGFRYAFSYSPIRAVLLFVACLSLSGMPYTVLLPIYAKEILGGGPRVFGWMTAAAGSGAMLAAVYLARRERIQGITNVIMASGAAFSVALFGFATSTSVALSLVLLFVLGFGMMAQSASCMTIVQTIVDPAKRGRVMSLYSMAFVGMAPFGSLAAGFMAKHWGAPRTLQIGAGLCAVTTWYFSRKLPVVREVLSPPGAEVVVGTPDATVTS